MKTQNAPSPEPDLESIFLFGGGRLRSSVQRLLIDERAGVRAGRFAVAATAVTWPPLLILAALERVAWGSRVDVTLIEDFLPYGQFVLALPVLILGEVMLAKHLGTAATELKRSNLVAAEDTPELDRLLARAVNGWRGGAIHGAFVALSCILSAVSIWGTKEWLTGGWQAVDGRVAFAGWWYLLVSMTVLRFAELRWLWRLLLWAWFQWRTSRRRLQPMPIHPDLAGGFAFLGATQTAFRPLAFALSAQVSSLLADAVLHRGANLGSFKVHVAAFALIVLGAILLPLLAFVRPLTRAKITHVGTLRDRGYRAAERIDQTLQAGEIDDLPAGQLSTLCDFGPLFENARRMRPVPLELNDVLRVALAVAIPLLPLALLVMPVEEIARTLAKLLV